MAKSSAVEKTNESTDADIEGRAAVAAESQEIVIGVVGYAGAGCTQILSKLEGLLNDVGYTPHRIKLSNLIARQFPDRPPDELEEGVKQGQSKLRRAKHLQDIGDEFRGEFGPHAVASLAVQEIKMQRGTNPVGSSKLVFILDSIKHDEEVRLLREVYAGSFRLIAVHCEREKRETRLIGKNSSTAKYRGANDGEVRAYMDRDEKDEGKEYGQQVREAFYLADYFIDNNWESPDATRLNVDLDRFVSLILGRELVRPTPHESGMYHAFSASLKSSCLSRQVGAALVDTDGALLSVGTNDVPRFGGGVYNETSKPDCRCFMWKWKDNNGAVFKGCHNSRRKRALEQTIADWLAENFSSELAKRAHPIPKNGTDTAAKARQNATKSIREFFSSESGIIRNLPGVKDLIEYSRSIHAEMDAIMTASRNGISTVDCSLFCTTFPCHSCARHLVTAGISEVFYIEPYVKSAALDLHSDALQTVLDESGSGRDQEKMIIVPFTGAGPRMYEDHFLKSSELKKDTGEYDLPERKSPINSVRLKELEHVENAAAELVPTARE